jgi:DNA invertase Pin-like site-specific DNA recombinase
MRMAAAIYARVSSEQQREAHTIASQTAALIEWAKTLDLEVPKAWIFEDEGFSPHYSRRSRFRSQRVLIVAHTRARRRATARGTDTRG